MAKIIVNEDGVLIEGGKVSVVNGEYSFEINGKKYIEAKATECCEPKQEPLKVGDYIKVVAAESSVAKNGDIFEIVRINCGFPYEGKRVEDGAVEQFYDREIVRVTDEEVVGARAGKKWAKIGRKPSEFKKGDIIKDVDGDFGFNYRAILTVYSDYLRCTGGVDIHVTNAKLITPTEARFDA